MCSIAVSLVISEPLDVWSVTGFQGEFSASTSHILHRVFNPPERKERIPGAVSLMAGPGGGPGGLKRCQIMGIHESGPSGDLGVLGGLWTLDPWGPFPRCIGVFLPASNRPNKTSSSEHYKRSQHRFETVICRCRSSSCLA